MIFFTSAPTTNASATTRLRRVNVASGIFVVFAGDGFIGSSGDGGQASSARFETPYGVCGASPGAMFVSDSDTAEVISLYKVPTKDVQYFDMLNNLLVITADLLTG